MAKSENQKMRIIYLKEMLEKYTDIDHGLTMEEILEKLQKLDITSERRAIYDDIRLLGEDGYGLPIQKAAGKDKTYRLLEHDFTLQEVKLLVDSVQASKFLSEKKSRDLLIKLEKLCSCHEAASLKREMLVANRVKQMNETIFINIDIIQRAIAENRQITFRYFEYALDSNNRKVRKYRSNGLPYYVSPWTMAYTDDNYYLLAYYGKHEEMRHYRVDRMDSIEILDALRQGEDAFNHIDQSQYTKYTFAMFHGKTEHVTIRFEHKLLNVMLDRFGSSVMAYQVDGEHYQITVPVSVSPQFFGWITGLGTQVRITDPYEVIRDYHQYLMNISEQYESTVKE